MNLHDFADHLIDHILGNGPVPPGVPTKPQRLSEQADTTAQRAAAFIEPFEGFRSAPYQDMVGVWTIGYGSTRDLENKPVSETTPPITATEASALVARDLETAIQAIQGEVKVTLTQNEMVALASFVYNLGVGALSNSTLLKKLNTGDFAGAQAEFAKWDHAGNHVVAALLTRREAEAKLFGTPDAKAVVKTA